MMNSFWGKFSRVSGEKEGKEGRDKRVLQDELFQFDSCYSSQQGFYLLSFFFFFFLFSFFFFLFSFLIKDFFISLCFSSSFGWNLQFLPF